MSTEVELKLALIPADAPSLRRHPLFAGLKATRRRVVSVYYDTPESLLSRKGIALRLRRSGGRWLQTLKSGGNSDAGLHSRSECEIVLPRGEINLELFAGTMLDKIDAAKLAAGLSPVFTTDFFRTTWLIEPSSGNRVEVALDQGRVFGGRREQAISELELELLDGDPDCLFDLATRLQCDFALRPDSLSKAERGYRMFGNAPLKPVKAAPVELDPEMTPAEAIRFAARSCLAQLEANEPGVLRARDSEFVHQARVALRRLRSTLKFASPTDESAKQLGNDLQPIASALGVARDWDVLVEQTLPPIALGFGEDSSSRKLLAGARRRRSVARSAARAVMTSRPYYAALLSLSRWLSAPNPVIIGTMNVTQFAAEHIRRQHKRLMRDASDITGLAPEQRHRVRIDIKRLRYGPECFVSLFRETPARRYLAELESAQDALGEINDGIVALQLVSGLKPAANLDFFIRGWFASRSPHLLRIAQSSLGNLARHKHFWKQPRKT